MGGKAKSLPPHPLIYHLPFTAMPVFHLLEKVETAVFL